MHESLFQVATMNLVSTKLTLGIQVNQGLPTYIRRSNQSRFPYDSSHRFHILKLKAFKFYSTKQIKTKAQ